MKAFIMKSHRISANDGKKRVQCSAAAKICFQHFMTLFNMEVVNSEIKMD